MFSWVSLGKSDMCMSVCIFSFVYYIYIYIKLYIYIYDIFGDYVKLSTNYFHLFTFLYIYAMHRVRFLFTLTDLIIPCYTLIYSISGLLVYIYIISYYHMFVWFYIHMDVDVVFLHMVVDLHPQGSRRVASLRPMAWRMGRMCIQKWPNMFERLTWDETSNPKSRMARI